MREQITWRINEYWSVSILTDVCDWRIGIYWFRSKSVESPYQRLFIDFALPMMTLQVRHEWGWKSGTAKAEEADR